MKRSFGAALACFCLLVLPASAAAVGWSSPATLLGPADRDEYNAAFFGGGTGALVRDAGGSGLWTHESADGGDTWSAPTAPHTVLQIGALAGDANASGQRVWALAAGSSVQVARGDKNLRPPFAAGTFSTITPGGGSISAVDVQINAAGDALIVWTVGVTGSVGASFWPAGAAAPNTGSTLDTSHAASTRAFGVLDPNRGALVVWGSDTGIWQARATDAALADPFAIPAKVADGSGARVASAPSGRAVLAFSQEFDTQPGAAQPVSRRVVASGRSPGGLFSPPTPLAGDDGRITTGIGPQVAISGAGRAIVAFTSSENVPGGRTCEQVLGTQWAHVAVGDPDALTATVVVGGGGVSGSNPHVAGGPDARLAMSWEEKSACGPPAPPNAVKVSFAPPTGGLSAIALPTGYPDTLAFREDGDLFALTIDASAFKVASYDTGVPVEGVPSDPGPGDPGPGDPGGGDPGGGAPGGGGGGGGASPGGSTPLPPISTPGGTDVEVNPPKFSSVKPGADGSVKVTLNSDPGTVQMDGFVKASGLVKKSAAKQVKVLSKRVVVKKAGKVVVTLKLTGKGLKTLKRKKKLKVSLKTTFTAAAGGAPATSTRSVTFALKKKR